METNNIPAGETVMPYLILKDAEKFQAFAEKVFGAKEEAKYMRDDNTIMHAEITLGNSKIMFAESGGEWGVNTAGMFVYVPDADETYRKALAQGATSLQEPQDQDYGRASGVRDPFGNTWWMTSVK